MIFLFKLVLYGILFFLALRVIRALSAPRSKPVNNTEPEAKPLRPIIKADRIQDANFTDINDQTK
jgi:hypothetical protein